MPVLNAKKLFENRVQAIRDYHATSRQTRAELDLSGGIDSAVMAGLLVEALGADNVTLAHLGINSNPEQTERAKQLAAGLGCKLAVGDFTNEYEMIVAKITATLRDAGYNIFDIERRIHGDPTILGSIRSTLRAPLGRAYNRITGGGIRHGTGNECEDRFLRFYQKGGDGEVDTNPIAMLSKTEVYQLAYYMAEHFPNARETYKATIRALPSPDLWGQGDKHNDETELASWTGAPFTYGRVDADTGKVTRIGTIERVARFLDSYVAGVSVEDFKTTTEVLLFHDTSTANLVKLAGIGANAPEFKGLDTDTIYKLLAGARKAEKATRHKLNPNCPALGDRASLIADGILSDNFDDYGLV